MDVIGEDHPCVEPYTEFTLGAIHLSSEEVEAIEIRNPGGAFEGVENEKIDIVGISGFISPVVDHGRDFNMI